MMRRLHRKGLRASRERLEMAMLDAGIRTQASLAEKIAEAENLACPPKDSVNRVFRGESVSPKTLARIAKALGVEPHQLYREDEVGPHRIPGNPEREPVLGRYSLVILSLTPTARPLCSTLHRIATGIKGTVIDAERFDTRQLSVDIARTYQSDGVLSLRIRRIGRFAAVQAFLYFDQVERLIWNESLLAAELERQTDRLAQNCRAALYGWLQREEADPTAPTPIDLQEKYLLARQLLEEIHSETKLRLAEEHLRSVLRAAPNLAEVHAALAEALIGESWRSDTRERLQEAQHHCSQALELSPDNDYALTVQSYLYRITGRIPQAIELCNNILDRDPDNILAVSAIALAYQEAADQGMDSIDQASRRAQEFAERAIRLEPDHWRHHFELGNMRYLGGDPVGAVPAYRESVRRKPNELAFINMGSVALCRGHLEEARDLFLQARELEPDSYLAPEYLGSLHFFSGDPGTAVTHYQQALDLVPPGKEIAIHQMWAELADASRLAGQTELAHSSYRKALEIIDRDRLQGYSSPSLTIYHYYYHYFLSQHDPEHYPPELLDSICPELAEQVGEDLPPAILTRLAILLHLQGQQEPASRVLDRAASICPLFRRHPDLVDLASLSVKHDS